MEWVRRVKFVKFSTNCAASLHCALASGAVYCNRSCLCVFVSLWRAGGRAVSELYYSQRARSVCVSLSAFFIFNIFFAFLFVY